MSPAPPIPQHLRRPPGRRDAPVPPLPPLDMRLLAELPSLELRARYLVEGFLSGRHRSPQKGSSVEFADYRDYQHGDDLRRVDWRLFGRSDRLHVKQFEEETQLRVFLVLDTSSSMDFRSRPEVMKKIEYARLVLAALGLLAQRQQDAFGLATVARGLGEFVRARSSMAHWRVFTGKLECVTPGGGTDLASALESLAELLPARSLVAIASDFYENPVGLQSALRRLRYDRHDIIGLHVLDPQEIDFDLDDSGTFVDAESGSRLKLDAASTRKNYLQRFGEFCAQLDEMFHEAGGEVARLNTSRPPMDALARYLAHREERT